MVKAVRKISPGLGKTGAGMVTECINCRSCEAACSFWREGEVNPDLSRIRMKSTELEWIEGTSDRIVEAKVCMQCPGVPPCILTCPVQEAIKRKPETGAVLIDETLCIRCKKCAEECPHGAIWFNEAKNKMLKCDLCGGEPKCVEWCPVNALKYVGIK